MEGYGGLLVVIIVVFVVGSLLGELAKKWYKNRYGVSVDDEVVPTAQSRDPRAPRGMSDIEYRGWKDRRDIADTYIQSTDAAIKRRRQTPPDS